MRVNFERRANVSELQKYKAGIKLTYGKGTMTGCAWCSCNKCVGELMIVEKDKVVGWLDTECNCGNKIDWSEADLYL